MTLVAKDTGGSGDFQIAPEGKYLAVCYRILDLGTQTYQDKAAQKVDLTFELHGENLLGDGHAYMTNAEGEPQLDKPLIVSARFTNSLHEKANLRGFLESWRNKAFTQDELEGFDLAKLEGVAAAVYVIHNHADNGKVYANIKSITPVEKGTNKPEPVNPTVVLDLSNFNHDVYNGLSEYMQELIAKSPEYQTAIANDNAPVEQAATDEPDIEEAF